MAVICENYGQRVQYSVFECSVSEMQLAKLRDDLPGHRWAEVAPAVNHRADRREQLAGAFWLRGNG